MLDTLRDLARSLDLAGYDRSGIVGEVYRAAYTGGLPLTEERVEKLVRDWLDAPEGQPQ
jgi:hypothetical protein